MWKLISSAGIYAFKSLAPLYIALFIRWIWDGESLGYLIHALVFSLPYVLIYYLVLSFYLFWVILFMRTRIDKPKIITLPNYLAICLLIMAPCIGLLYFMGFVLF